MLYFHLLLSRKSNLLVGFNVCAYHLKDLQNKFSAVFFIFYYVHKKRFISFICEVFGKYIYKYIHIKVLVQITNSIIFGVWQNPHPFHILKGILGGRITSAYKER